MINFGKKTIASFQAEMMTVSGQLTGLGTGDRNPTLNSRTAQQSTRTGDRSKMNENICSERVNEVDDGLPVRDPNWLWNGTTVSAIQRTLTASDHMQEMMAVLGGGSWLLLKKLIGGGKWVE